MTSAEFTHAAQASHVQQGEGRPQREIIAADKCDVAKRAANAFRLYVESKTAYGRIHAAAREEEPIADHAFSHFRRMGKWQRQISQHYTFHNPHIVMAMGLIPDNHDADQLDTSYRNYKTGSKRNPRGGHESAGALRLVTLSSLHAEAVNTSLQESREITGFAAAMTILHDTPELLPQALSQTGKVHGRKPYTLNRLTGERTMLHADALIACFKKGCDLLALSPKQIRGITRYYKEEADEQAKKKDQTQFKFITDETPYGLDPQFEHEFAHTLNNLDDEPLVASLSRRDRREFVLATEINVLADTLDMVIPVEEAFLRTLANEHARTRSLYDDDARRQVFELIGTPKKDTDLSRKVREIVMLTKAIKNSKLAKSHFATHELPEIQAKALSRLKDIGSIFMQGDVATVGTFVQEVVEQRVESLAESHMRRSGVIIEPRGENETIYDYASRVTGTLRLQPSFQTRDFAEQILTKAIQIRENVDTLMEAITDPRKYAHDPDEPLTQPGMKQFSQAHIHAYQNLCDDLLYESLDPNVRTELHSYGIQPLVHEPHAKMYMKRYDENDQSTMPPIPYELYRPPLRRNQAKIPTWQKNAA